MRGNFLLVGIKALSQALYIFLVDLRNERNAIPAGLKRRKRLNEKIEQRKVEFNIRKALIGPPAPCDIA